MGDASFCLLSCNLKRAALLLPQVARTELSSVELCVACKNFVSCGIRWQFITKRYVIINRINNMPHSSRHCCHNVVAAAPAAVASAVVAPRQLPRGTVEDANAQRHFNKAGELS